MIPETDNSCETVEQTIIIIEAEDDKPKSRQEAEVASVTAWKRYEKFVSLIESQGVDFNKKSTIEAMFRGRDLVYGHL